jgi:signal transduction histidine kinase/CheY-like chemotaxis protein
MKPKRPSFELRVIAVLAIVVVLVSLIGVYTLNGLNGIVAEVKEATKPNHKISLLNQVIADLTDAESSIKSYRMTKDDSYLSPFYEAISSVDDRMSKLYRQSAGEAYQEDLADSVERLVQLKYAILNQFLILEENPRINKELEIIAEKLNKAAENLSQTQEPVRSNIFQNIFGAGKKDTNFFKKFNFETENRKEEKSNDFTRLIKLDFIKEKELYLAKEDRLVMDKIRSAVKKMELYERNSNAKKAIKITKIAKSVNFYILVFCVLSTTLLAFISYFIITYVRKNKAYRSALKKAKTQAENLAKVKETFLANMSHEIRTPLNAIAGFTYQVLQSELTKKQKEQLEIVKKSSDHLLQIINDILDYSKIQSGKFNFEKVGFSPRKLAKEVVLLMQPAAEHKKLKISSRVAKSVPEICLGDPVRLRQIILNLLANAIKFTEVGKVSLSLSAVQQSANQVTLRLTVKDTGTGISEEKLKIIFNEFEQADSSVSRKFGGTGLGLSISKKLTELQNGSINIQSEEGKGTSVSIIIPYEIGTEKELIEEHEEKLNTTKRLEGTKILVADDEEYNRLLIKTILEKWGVNVTLVKNGREAVEVFEKNTYEAILMDVLMPEMGGIEASKIIHKQSPATPILALTATTRPQKIEECKAAGMIEVLSKPFNEVELYEILVETITNKTLPKKEHKKPTKANKKDRYNLQDLKNLANGDKAFVQEMIEIFINTTQKSIANMLTDFENKNWESLADNAHKAAPPCRHLQANILLEKLKKIETRIRDEKNTSNLSTLISEAKKEAQLIISELQIEMKNL